MKEQVGGIKSLTMSCLLPGDLFVSWHFCANVLHTVMLIDNNYYVLNNFVYEFVLRNAALHINVSGCYHSKLVFFKS